MSRVMIFFTRDIRTRTHAWPHFQAEYVGRAMLHRKLVACVEAGA